MPDWEHALHTGLRAQPVPAISPDFDARVLAALRVPQPWWLRLWQPAKPLLTGASFSLTLTLICLHWSLSAPVMSNLTPPLLGAGGPSALAARPAPSLDALLDRPNLSAASLSEYWNTPPLASTTQDRRPEPRRHAQSRRCESLVA